MVGSILCTAGRVASPMCSTSKSQLMGQSSTSFHASRQALAEPAGLSDQRPVVPQQSRRMNRWPPDRSIASIMGLITGFQFVPVFLDFAFFLLFALIIDLRRDFVVLILLFEPSPLALSLFTLFLQALAGGFGERFVRILGFSVRFLLMLMCNRCRCGCGSRFARRRRT